MKYLNLHSWELGHDEAVEAQRNLRDRIMLEPPEIDLGLVAGADVSYSRGSSLFFASVVVLEMPGVDIVEEKTAKGIVNFPYIPGLLSFREAPVLIKAFEKIDKVPDVVMFDGQGIAHPRGVGLASHMGLMLDLPTIGCAKKILVGEYDHVGNEAGDYAHISYRNKVVGAALRTKQNVKPVFISPGHRMDIATAVKITMETCRGYKLPEPTRQAHLSVNRARTAHYSAQEVSEK